MKTIVIKAGGRAAEASDSIRKLAEEIKKYSQENINFVFVHGGGSAVSSIQKQYGIEPCFIDGKRLTSAYEMDLVDMGLAGLMNKSLVRVFNSSGLNSVGLSGADAGLIVSSEAQIQGEIENRTGSVAAVDAAIVTLLLEHGYLPVLSSVSTAPSGKGMNINADEAALAIAVALQADDLIFISDIPGILIDGSVKHSMGETSIHSFIDSGDIQGGMIPKVQSSLAAIRQGVDRIQISNYEESGDLKRILDGVKGTCITLEDTE